MKIFFDGGLRPLPAGMEWAVVLGGRTHMARGLGPGTSMTAEWLALIAATRLAYAEHVADAVLLGDAAAVIAQATGVVRARGGAAAHLAAFRLLADAGPTPRIRHIRRTQNLAGIALARAREKDMAIPIITC